MLIEDIAFPLNDFCFTSPHCNPLSTWARGQLNETRNYSLKEDEAVFLKRQNLIISRVAESISFFFLFLTKYFSRKDLKFVVTFCDLFCF